MRLWINISSYFTLRDNRHIWRHLLTQNFSVTSTAVENTWERRLNPLIIDDVTHFSEETLAVSMTNIFNLCITIVKRAYVLLAAWFPTRGAQCCRGRVRFSCTASTWWVWQTDEHLNAAGYFYLAHFTGRVWIWASILHAMLLTCLLSRQLYYCDCSLELA